MSFQADPTLSECNPKQGATFLTNDWSVIDAWYAFHQNAGIWGESDRGTKLKCDDTLLREVLCEQG